MILLSLFTLFIIPKVSYSAMTMKDEQAQTCSFCKEQKGKSSTVTMPCNHLIHIACANKCFKYSYICPTCHSGLTTYFIASLKEQLSEEQINRFVKTTVAINRYNNYHENGNSSLHNAVIERNFDAVKILLLDGANPNNKNKDGNTALHLAAENGDLELVKWLVANGTDINTKNNDGFLPMQLAIQKDQTAAVEVLLAAQFTYISTLSAPDRKDILTLAARLQPLAK